MKTPSDYHFHTIEQVAKMLLTYHEELHTWDAVAERFGLSKPLVWRVATQHYEPKKSEIRHRLGLSVYAPAPVCRHCGEVHVSARCPHRRRPYRTLSEMPVEVLRWKLENREVVT